MTYKEKPDPTLKNRPQPCFLSPFWSRLHDELIFAIIFETCFNVWNPYKDFCICVVTRDCEILF